MAITCFTARVRDIVAAPPSCGLSSSMSILLVAGVILFVLLDVLALVFVFQRLAAKRAAAAQSGKLADPGPPRSGSMSRVLVVLTLVIGLVVASTYGLGALNGAVPDDLRCQRAQAARSCEILGSTGLGLVGDRVSVSMIPRRASWARSPISTEATAAAPIGSGSCSRTEAGRW